MGLVRQARSCRTGRQQAPLPARMLLLLPLLLRLLRPLLLLLLVQLIGRGLCSDSHEGLVLVLVVAVAVADCQVMHITRHVYVGLPLSLLPPRSCLCLYPDPSSHRRLSDPHRSPRRL